MFKVGQVWQGTRNKGHIILIKRVHEIMPLVNVEFINGPRKGYKGWVYAGTVETQCALIGNNYQERSTEPARPGTAFKRWLGERTSGIPEQRGCRKEDC